MNQDDRKKITANELYLNECMTILYSKVRASGFNFFGSDGNVLQNNILNIENYAHGTITCTCNPNSIRLRYDGTNFAPIFTNNDKGGFMYRLKPLGIDYTCSDRVIGEDIHEKKIIRRVGESADYYRYLSSGIFNILLEHRSKDENGVIIINNTKVEDYNDDELVEYMKYQMHVADQLGLNEDDEELDELEDFFPDDDGESIPVLKERASDELTPRDIAEIEAYADDSSSYSDIFTIDYTLKDFTKEWQIDDKPYQLNFSEKIEDFDYQKYINDLEVDFDLKSSHDEEASHKYEDNVDEMYDEQTSFDDEYEDEDEYEVEDDMDEETDSIYTDDTKYFEVFINGEEVKGHKKTDIIADSAEEVKDVNQEIMTLKDYYCDIMSEIRKMRAIIIKRRDIMVRRKTDQTSTGTAVGESSLIENNEIEK